MSGIFFVDSIRRWMHGKNREKKLAAAQSWPMTIGEINHWSIVGAEEQYSSSGTPYQIEAAFHFKVNGEYFGGYLRSVAMGHHDAEVNAKGTPEVRVRYDPINPNTVAVLEEDNAGNLGFRVISG